MGSQPRQHHTPFTREDEGLEWKGVPPENKSRSEDLAVREALLPLTRFLDQHKPVPPATWAIDRDASGRGACHTDFEAESPDATVYQSEFPQVNIALSARGKS